MEAQRKLWTEMDDRNCLFVYEKDVRRTRICEKVS
jgi:hypothetical protein